MSFTDHLPNPTPPTYHPDYNEMLFPKINVFQVMPVRKLGAIVAGDTLNVNIATYVDPLWESDIIRSIHSKPRWMQGILLHLDELEPAFTSEFYNGWNNTLKWGDEMFTGKVANHGADIPVVGVLHSNAVGWLGFRPDQFGDEALKTIADFKAAIGQLDPMEARRHNDRWQFSGEFLVKNRVMS